MNRLLLAKLEPEDLVRYRLADTIIDVMKITPSAFGRDEIRDAFVRWYQMRGEFAVKYGLPEHGHWDISLATGAVTEDGE